MSSGVIDFFEESAPFAVNDNLVDTPIARKFEKSFTRQFHGIRHHFGRVYL